MQNPKEAIKQIQALTYGAYQASGQVAALIGASRPENMAEALEQTAARMEQGTVHLRTLCESCLPPVPAVGQKPALSPLDAAGKVEVIKQVLRRYVLGSVHINRDMIKWKNGNTKRTI